MRAPFWVTLVPSMESSGVVPSLQGAEMGGPSDRSSLGRNRGSNTLCQLEWRHRGICLDEGEIFTDLDIVDKDSFEEAFDLANLSEYSQFRVVALDRNDQVLGQSDVVTHQPERGWWSFVLAVVAWAVIFRIAWCSYKWLARQKGSGLAWKTFGSKQ